MKDKLGVQSRRSFLGLAGAFALSSAVLSPNLVLASSGRGRHAIVMDDAGSGNKDNIRNLELLADADVPLTVAVLPFFPRMEEAAKILGRYASADVILHQPMEPVSGYRNGLEPSGVEKGSIAIMGNDSPDDALGKLSRNFDGVQEALSKYGDKKLVGLNNHMGSRVTQDPSLMAAVAQYAKERGLIALDSVTIGSTVLHGKAAEVGAKALRRTSGTMFLENAKMNPLKTLSRSDDLEGDIVSIGHMHGEGSIPGVIAYHLNEGRGKELVGISKLV